MIRGVGLLVPDSGAQQPKGEVLSVPDGNLGPSPLLSANGRGAKYEWSAIIFIGDSILQDLEEYSFHLEVDYHFSS